MDSRIALAANTQLHFRNKEGGAVRYTIIKEIGCGGSCIVYDASYETNNGDLKYVRIKENLLSAFYDHALGGAYDAIDANEEHLLTEMADATDKTIRYARKSHRPGSKHLLAENLLTKATMLMRSEPDRKKQIDKLIAEAEKKCLPKHSRMRRCGASTIWSRHGMQH